MTFLTLSPDTRLGYSTAQHLHQYIQSVSAFPCPIEFFTLLLKPTHKHSWKVSFHIQAKNKTQGYPEFFSFLHIASVYFYIQCFQKFPISLFSLQTNQEFGRISASSKPWFEMILVVLEWPSFLLPLVSFYFTPNIVFKLPLYEPAQPPLGTQYTCLPSVYMCTGYLGW